MLREFFGANAPKHYVVGAWSGVLLIVAHKFYTSWLNVACVLWAQDFYDARLDDIEALLNQTGNASNALREEAVARTWEDLWAFCWLTAPSFAIHPMCEWCATLWRNNWRYAVIESYARRWLHVPTLSRFEDAAQCIHEDVGILVKCVHKYVADLLEAIFTLALFAPRLYAWSQDAFWALAVTAIAGLAVSRLLGWRADGLELRYQHVQAAMRRSMEEYESDIRRGAPVIHPLTPSLADDCRRCDIDLARVAASYQDMWAELIEQAGRFVLPVWVAVPKVFSDDPAVAISVGTWGAIAQAALTIWISFEPVMRNNSILNQARAVRKILNDFEVVLAQYSGANTQVDAPGALQAPSSAPSSAPEASGAPLTYPPPPPPPSLSPFSLVLGDHRARAVGGEGVVGIGTAISSGEHTRATLAKRCD